MPKKVKYSSKYIDEVRQFFYGQNARVVGNNTYKRKYKNEKVNHVTIEYVEDGKLKYKPLPQFAVNRAKEKQIANKWKPITTRQDVIYRGKHPLQHKYKGKYTYDEIKNFAQNMSNDNAKAGKKGLFEVAVPNWGHKDGLWKTSSLRNYGAPIQWLSNYDGSEIPEDFDEFMIYELPQ